MVNNNFYIIFSWFFKNFACIMLSCRSTGGLQAFDFRSAVGRPSGHCRATVGERRIRRGVWMNTTLGGKSVVWWMNTIIRGGKSVVWWMNTILGGSHSFRKRKDVPGAKVVHFFEICKYLGSFYAILEYFYQQKSTMAAEDNKGSERG